MKVNGPDYRGMAADIALSDFLKRIEHYKKNYSPIDETEEANLSFMKIFNTGEPNTPFIYFSHRTTKFIHTVNNKRCI